MGRPSKYKEEFAEQAQKLCRLGAIDKELADFFDISEVTLNAWKKEHKGFLKSLKEGKELADAEVADKLFKRATGYSHDDVHISNYQGSITITPIIKNYAPDTTACIFWLKNRRPDLWRDKTDIGVNVPDSDELLKAISSKLPN